MFRIGRGNLERILLATREYRDRARDRIEAAHRRGIDVFDVAYRPIPGTDPQKYRTCYDQLLERELQPLYDALVGAVPGGTFALCVDVNGYAPTHNAKYSRPPTGDRAADLVQSRDKRIFSDPTGIRAAKSVAALLLQTYRRDTGEVLNDLSLPIHVAGRHWGALRLGFDPRVVFEGEQGV
jgi:methyl-accepting chemotaxis protein